MKNEIVRAFACYNKDEDIRSISTSGGLFYLFAAYVINELNGKVCGAVFDEKYQVVHTIVDNTNDLVRLLGSKYPQSNMKGIYSKIKAVLQADKIVLFCGTPCQVEGLLTYLGRKPDNLWLIDFVCHGVASPMIWREYLEAKANGKGIELIRFKDKKFGWKHWHVHIKTNDADIYEDANQNLFMKSYLSRVNIRPSCYECPFKGLDRYSDFTLADCWGIGECNKRINDDRGLSALLIHSNRGLELFKMLSEDIVQEEYEPGILMKKNWAATKQTESSVERIHFYLFLSRRGVNKALSRFFGDGLRKRVMRKVCKCFDKLKEVFK